MRNLFSKSNLILLIIAIITTVLTLISILFLSKKDIRQLDSNTPEGVVQLYLNEVIDGRYENAISYLSNTSTCDATDLDRSYLPNSLKVNLASVETTSDTSLIKIEVEIQSGGPFNDTYSETHNYRLAKENNNWKILGIPWPMWECGAINK